MRLFFIILLYITLLHSTTVSGQIFNGDDNQLLNNTLITIEDSNGNTVVQKSCNGYYNLEVPSGGNYTLRAYHYLNGSLEYYTDNKFQASQDSIQFDLVLIPYELQKLVPSFTSPPLANKTSSDDTSLSSHKQTDQIGQFYIDNILIIAALVIIIYFVYRFYLNNFASKKDVGEKSEVQKTGQYELDEDCKNVFRIIKENEGRMVQKELREILNFSETKMSLIVTELEALGLIKRIKKGRENILKLVNKK